MPACHAMFSLRYAERCFDAAPALRAAKRQLLMFYARAATKIALYAERAALLCLQSMR